MKKEYEEMLEAAADWWAASITESKQDNGDAFQSVMVNFVVSKISTSPTEDQLNLFKSLFIGELSLGLTTFSSKTHEFIGVDYHPDHVLEICAKAANINPIRFPMKSGMSLDYKECTVKAARGYRAEFKQIYPRVEEPILK